MELAATLYHQDQKNPYTMTHCWLKLNGKHECCASLFGDLKNHTRKRWSNDGSQYIVLYYNDDPSGVADGQMTVSNRKIHIPGGGGTHQGRVACEGGNKKNVATGTHIFSNKDETLKIMEKK